MKKPSFPTTNLPERKYEIETAADAVDAILAGSRPTATSKAAVNGKSPRPAKRPVPAPARAEQEEPPAVTPSPPKAKEIVQRYTVYPYPSQLDKLRRAVADYKARHPKGDLTVNDLVRMGLDDVPPGGPHLDQFVHRHRGGD